MMKFVFALVLATASANFVQLGRTTAGSGGDTNDRHDWVDVTFPTAFTSTPVVILGVPSAAGGDPVMGIVKDVTTTGFKFQAAEPSCYDEWHVVLKFDWMAVLAGVYTVDGSTFEAGFHSATGVTGHTNSFETITFAGSYASIPSVVAQVQDASAHSYNNEFYINTRHHHLTTTSVGVLINEMSNYGVNDMSVDLGSTGANVGYVIMEETSSSSIQAKTTETSADCLNANPHATNCRTFASTHIGGVAEEKATFSWSAPLASEGFVFAQTITYNGPDHVTLRLSSESTGTAAASALSGATDITLFVEEPGKCWSASDLTHPNEEAVSYMVFTATAFAASIDALTATATVTFELQVANFVQSDLAKYIKAIAAALGVHESSITITVSGRRLVEATSATLVVTVSTGTAAVVEAAVVTTSFCGTTSDELATEGVTTTLTVDPATVAAVAATCSVTCAVSSADLVQVLHSTASQHTHHRCHVDSVSQACICSCCNTATADCDVASNYQL